MEPKNRQDNRKNEREGVVYEPSNRPKPETTVRIPKQRQKPQKSQFALFYIITLVTGVVVCLVVFAIFYNNIRGDRQLAEASKTSPSPSASVMPVAIGEEKVLVGMITDINVVKNQLEIIDTDNNQFYTVGVDAKTGITNKYDQEIIFAELSLGDIVKTSFNVKTSVLTQVQLAPEAWEHKLVKGVVVNPITNQMENGNDIFTFDEQLLALYQGKAITPEDISPIDLVTISGFKDKVWFVDVVKSHGSIEVINKEKVKGGALEIDTTVFMPLSEEVKVDVLEGPHKVVVKGDNIEPLVTDVLITQGQIEIIDLALVQYKSAVVAISANVSDFTLTVDGTETPTNEPLVLDLGTYVFEATKEGYAPWKETVEVTTDTTNVNIVMSETVVLHTLKIETEPQGAQVYIDNGNVGTAPVSEALTKGKHSISVRKEGYTDFTIQIDIDENVRPLRFTLQKKDPSALPAETTQPEDTFAPTPADGGELIETVLP